jgi:L-asparaginase II
MPLAGIAHLYARLAQGSADPEFGEAFGAIFTAMTGHPELVSGEARGDLAYMRTAPGDWISKAGADGVQVLGSRSAGLGLAVKVADGSARALQVAVVEALGQLGLLQGRSGELLAAWKNPAIRNHRGLQTGAVRPIFNLRR